MQYQRNEGFNWVEVQIRMFSALHRYGTSTPKSVAGMVLDQAGRPSQQITYGELWRRFCLEGDDE